MADIVILDQFRKSSAGKNDAPQTGTPRRVARPASVSSGAPSLFTPTGYATAIGLETAPDSAGFAVAQRHIDVTRALNPSMTARDLRADIESDVAYWKPRLALARHFSIDYFYGSKRGYYSVDAVTALTAGFNYFAQSSKDTWPTVNSRIAHMRHTLIDKPLDWFIEKHPMLSPISRCAYLVRTHAQMAETLSEISKGRPIDAEQFSMATSDFAPLMDAPEITQNWGTTMLVKSMRGELAKLNQLRLKLSAPKTPLR